MSIVAATKRSAGRPAVSIARPVGAGAIAPHDGSGIAAAEHPPYGFSRGVKGQRETMEDKHLYALWRLPSGETVELFSLYDGHGGRDVSRVCAQLIPAVIRRHLSSTDPRRVKDAMRRSFHEVQALIASESKRYANQGTTAIVCLRIGNRIYCANAGDSRAVLVQRAGATLALSHDHKPCYPPEKQRLESMGSGVYWDEYGTCRVKGIGLSVSRGLGDLESWLPAKGMYVVSPDPEIKTLELQPGKRDLALVMACDGLWDVVPSEELGILVDPLNPKGSVDGLVRLAMKRDSGDNVSVMVVPFVTAAAG